MPITTPAAPQASAPTSCEPVPMPPPIRKGMLRSRSASAWLTTVPTMSRPGWPPHSAPTMETASTPTASALRAKRTEGTLWSTWMPASFRIGRNGSGLRPEVSTKRTPSPASRRKVSPTVSPSTSLGSIETFTPKARPPQASRARAISARRAAGSGKLAAVRKPTIPDRAQAAT